MIEFILLIGFYQHEPKMCHVTDCSDSACPAENECLIETPEGSVCSTRRWITVDDRGRFWNEDDIITCPVNDIDPI